MPDYEDILEQSEQNIVALKQQIEAFQSLYEDLKRRIEQTDGIPAKYDEFFEKIRKLSEDYLNGLGKAVQIYVEGNNKLFKDRIGELSKLYISLKHEIDRLSKIDLEKHFDKHQKTLSEIFKAINDINLTLTSITNTLGSISQSISALSSLVRDHQKKNIEEFDIIRNSIKDFQNSTQSEFSDLKSILGYQNRNQRIDRIIIIAGFVIIIGILLYMHLK